jgi:glycosyltransferase involved in cell wall biosynthesis
MDNALDIAVLVTTMYQKDFELIKEMNIQCQSIVANQDDKQSFDSWYINGFLCQMVTTDTRGLSRNRNISIALASSEYLLFSDDDLIFDDDYIKIIEEEFQRYPDADAIKFGVQSMNPARPLSYKTPNVTKRATVRNVTSAGVIALVIRRKIIEQKNLFFHENFGAGRDLYCGEDTIFLNHLVRRGGVLYLSCRNIAKVKQDGSSWFEGYNKKYFNTIGTVLGYLYPILSYLLALRSSYKFAKRKTNMNFFQIFRCYLDGIKKSKKL